MNKIILGIALASISFWSCHKSSQKLQEKIDNSVPVASVISHQKSVEVNIDLNKDCLPFDSLMTKVNYVKLETTSDNLVGGISQILFVDEKIIVVDAEKERQTDRADVAMGAMMLWEYRAKWYGETEEQAKAAVQQPVEVIEQ